MKAVIQRVSRAEVRVKGGSANAIGKGLMILLGVSRKDTDTDVNRLAEKISALRIFEDDAKKMNLSILDVGGDALVVSQFTLLASTEKGKRPSFSSAAPPKEAILLYKDFVDRLSVLLDRKVSTGKFGAAMEVELINEGPVTIVLDSKNRV